MKLNVFIIKKNHVFLFFSSIILFCIMVVFFREYDANSDYVNFNEATVVTMSNTKDDDTIKKDLNGDGNEDLLYIASKNGKYYLEASINNKTLALNPNKQLNTLGYSYPYWPMSLSFIDLNRDKKPELIIQSSQDNSPVQHIFVYNNNEFQDIYSSTNNIIGILDSKNNKTPKLFSLSIKNGISEIQNYMIIDNTIKNISYENYQIPAINSIERFVNLIESPYVIAEPPSIFSENINSNDFSILWRLDKDNFSYVLEDAFFTDTKWDKDGKTETISWNMNFKRTNKTNISNIDRLNIKLEISKNNSGYLISKIKSIQK
ncbi:Repeat domain-containing protein [Clostridium cavendishii DSM 21758]|uniref:Repeat domain-containing protein n=1 Tax=Clostridium cavendishii DSM 21758 TaxID=1121302 RepID=A0A1M6EKN2_9CLOT|nr:VCBS repeat-containing protein [Clostridium cavendishii]SHI86047.1 Repeat domain-containing protein [Clostridium cavendishii DSM 21758]